MDSGNPSPFVQPFLVLNFGTGEEMGEEWWIDVNGKIDLYFDPETKQPTELLLRLCKLLASQGKTVQYFGSYGPGDAGPSHILRNGDLFRRMGEYRPPNDDDPEGRSLASPPVPEYHPHIG